MNPETKNCQNCKKDFVIEPEDFAFYEKIKVPPPTFCPWCRFVRRQAWRNERTLYKRTCDLCNKSIIAMYPQDSVFPVYCKECWYSDKWDGGQYGREYDFSKNFFEQFKELLNSVPRLSLWQRNATNSDFSNMSAEVKNVYLSASVVSGSENVSYSRSIDGSFYIFDSYNVVKSDNCYENVDGEQNYNSQYLFLSRNCIDSKFLVDCVNCTNCVMSSNLRNKEFYIRNKPYSKEQYFEELKKIDFGSRSSRNKLYLEWRETMKKAVFRFANITRSSGSTGNNLHNTKECFRCFDTYDSEKMRYSYRSFRMKDSMDFGFGSDSELIYEYSTGAKSDYNVKYSFSALGNVRDSDYTEYCISSSDLFGCAGLKNKQYHILNKAYSPEEYKVMREKIIAHMNEMPFKTAMDIEYKYGEFWPLEIAPFAYNETLAQDTEPLTKEEAQQKGYRFKDPEIKTHLPTISAGDIPDNISEVREEILKEILECADMGRCNHQCSKAYRLTPEELQFYKKHSIPVPDRCANCRYYTRITLVAPVKVWQRKCMCEGLGSKGNIYKNTVSHVHSKNPCPNEFETSYAPDRPEIVYCDSCYNNEIN